MLVSNNFCDYAKCKKKKIEKEERVKECRCGKKLVHFECLFPAILSDEELEEFNGNNLNDYMREQFILRSGYLCKTCEKMKKLLDEMIDTPTDECNATLNRERFQMFSTFSMMIQNYMEKIDEYKNQNEISNNTQASSHTDIENENEKIDENGNFINNDDPSLAHLEIDESAIKSVASYANVNQYDELNASIDDHENIKRKFKKKRKKKLKLSKIKDDDEKLSQADDDNETRQSTDENQDEKQAPDRNENDDKPMKIDKREHWTSSDEKTSGYFSNVDMDQQKDDEPKNNQNDDDVKTDIYLKFEKFDIEVFNKIIEILVKYDDLKVTVKL